jgi:heptaprenyl diphosphate synthase
VHYKRFYISDAIKASIGQKRVFFIAFLATMAIFLAIAEHMIPKPLPWMRIGLANAITLYAFTILRKREVFLIVLSRVVATSLLIGSFMSLGFLLSIAGAVSSFIMMSMLFSYCRKVFSLVGISILGAVTSNLVQLLLVNAVFVRSSISYYFIPMVLLLALVGGILSGLFGRFLSENL